MLLLRLPKLTAALVMLFLQMKSTLNNIRQLMLIMADIDQGCLTASADRIYHVLEVSLLTTIQPLTRLIKNKQRRIFNHCSCQQAQALITR